ncbi:hypothetical protein UPYG_G00081420 [Umbra pygmaea]|uniref:Uncharacterized protein n=1 Tax=Umbra pygmaea TaxID=75934 RepID=A0ABD0XDS1_UMBPY
MKTRDFLLIFICIPATMGDNDNPPSCEDVLRDCQNKVSWTRCFEARIARCVVKSRRPIRNFYRISVNSSVQAEGQTRSGHRVQIPPNALQRSKRNESIDTVLLTMVVLNNSLFRLGPDGDSWSGEVMGQSVLAVRVGDQPVSGLEQPVKIVFKSENVTNGACVFWKESEEINGTGHWSPEGCKTNFNYTEFVCSCNHLSFFAVLVNSDVVVDPVNAANLSYISYIGSGLSVVFTSVILLMYICFRKGRSEHSVGIHVQLTSSLLFLHTSYLLSEWWVWYKADGAEGRVCLAIGLILHWALLSTFTWLAVEGFHLYVLLVRIFNIYVRKYLLKLSLIGWGIPTVAVVICVFGGVYGRHQLYLTNGFSTDICWISSFMVVSYVTVIGYLGLVFLFNTVMLVVVMVKLCRQREKGAIYQERRGRMWKDWATVLGLSCVLGIPWGLAFCTFGPLSLPGLYLFSIFNSFQGVFMFLWFLALSHNRRPHQHSQSGKGSSSQKMMETSLNSKVNVEHAVHSSDF